MDLLILATGFLLRWHWAFGVGGPASLGKHRTNYPGLIDYNIKHYSSVYMHCTLSNIVKEYMYNSYIHTETIFLIPMWSYLTALGVP